MQFSQHSTGPGFMFVLGPCFVCWHPFIFDPERVPALVVEGVNRPICRTCVEKVNRVRASLKKDLLEILPGSYGEGE